MSNGKMPDLNALMKQAQKLQGDVQRAQEELAKMTCEGTSGGGLVTATVNGQFEVVKIKIDKSVVDPSDIGMLEDLDQADRGHRGAERALGARGDSRKDARGANQARGRGARAPHHQARAADVRRTHQGDQNRCLTERCRTSTP